MAEPPFDKCVFINCPFDKDYEGILQAVLFCIVYIGFVPRIATERMNAAEVRLSKISELPSVDDGDLLAFLDTGAYQDASATNFNAMPRPATVLVDGDRHELIKRAESIDDVFARDLIPERLRSVAAP